MNFFKKYETKTEGAIRFYDVKQPKTKVAVVLIFLACIILVVIALFPAFWLIMSSLKSIQEYAGTNQILPKNPDWGGWVRTWNALGFTKYYINSGIAVLGGVVCAVFFNGMLAYVLGILKPKGHKLIFALVMWSMLIPPTTSFVALFINIKKIGLTGSFIPLWLSMGANAYWVILFKNYFESLPRDYIDAARIDGCTNFRLYWSIIMPLAKPAIASAVIMDFLYTWNEFMLQSVLITTDTMKTVPNGLLSFFGEFTVDYGLLNAGVLISILPVFLVYLIFQKYFVSGMAGAVKG